MGWVIDNHHHHDHEHGDDGCTHEHIFEPKKWILIVSTILGSLAIYHMIIGLFWQGPIITFLDNKNIQLIIGTMAFFLMGIAFIKGSIVSLFKKELSEDTLVAIATSSAYFYSLSVFIVNAVTGMNLPYFFYEQVEVLWLIYLGRFIEEWLTHKVSKEINSLENLKPKLALVLRDNKEIEITADKINVGDIVIVKAGQQVPVDGKVIEGNTTIDESSLTGESLPITKKVGSNVFGGTFSSNGMIKIKVEKILEESFISQIINSVNESIKTKPRSQRIADKIATWLIPFVLIIAFVTFIITGLIFSLFLDVPNNFENMANTNSAWLYSYYILITILIIACPCSFSMTAPMTVLASQTTSKKEGVIFSSNVLFETIKFVDVICFDKTGTLTEGKFNVISTNINDKHLIDIVSIEKTSNHPLANSILNHFSNIETKKIEVNEIIGKGLESSNMKIGSLKWVNEFHKDFIEEEYVSKKRNDGSVFIYAFNEKEIYGYIELKDEIKDTTLMALSQIRKMGIDVFMITGDNKETSLSLAGQLGISPKNVRYEVTPQNKSEIIKELQKEGKVVTFVGDGVNDSVALVQADIGIAMGEGSDVAIESADIILRENDLSLVAYSIWLSRRTLYTIKRGFSIAIIYNAIMVPLAATGLLGLTGAGPALAALSMMFNDSVAMLNAMTLKNETKNKYERKYKKK